MATGSADPPDSPAAATRSPPRQGARRHTASSDPHIVGTPAAQVGRANLINLQTGAPRSHRWGITMVAPFIQARERKAPRVYMEHRHQGQDPVLGPDDESRAPKHGQRVQKGGTVAVRHASGDPRGPTRITDSRRGRARRARATHNRAFAPPAIPRNRDGRQARPGRRKKAVVPGRRRRERSRWWAPRATRRTGAATGWRVPATTLSPASAMMRARSAGRQAHVEGMQHGTHAGHREICLQVLLAVPHQRRHPLPGPDSQVGESGRQAFHAVSHLGETR